MAEAVTYSSLLTDIIAHFQRGSTAAVDPVVVAQLPRKITLAERQISADLKVQGFQEEAVGLMTAGDSVIAKPDRWRETISINFGQGPRNRPRAFLLPRSYETARMYWPDEAIRGVPRFYADYGITSWLITPTPDEAYGFEVVYYAIPPLLGPTVQENWLTQLAPNLILYQTLIKMSELIQHDDRVPLWKGAYAEALAAVNEEDVRKVTDRSSTRSAA